MKKENKKKVVTLSAMAALLAVVLGMGGKTYAKYFTSNTTDAQTATVAQWGLVSNLKTAGSAFAQTYETGNETVVSSGEHMVVAPGTEGSITYTVSGKAEVDAQIKFSVTEYTPISLTGGDLSTDYYYPIKWTVKVDTAAEQEYDNLNEAIFAPINYEANSSGDHTVVVSWSWDFGANDGQLSGNDKYDTALAQFAYKAENPTFNVDTEYASYTAVTEMSYKFSVTMVQVD